MRPSLFPCCSWTILALHATAEREKAKKVIDAAAEAEKTKVGLEMNAKVEAFALYIVGEGIEKKKDDFAAEVAAMSKG